MQFRTQIPIQKSNHQLDYDSKVVSLGSCFAAHIGDKFTHHQFRNVANPFGIIFQPLALAEIIRFAVTQKIFTDTDIFEHNGIWHSFAAHSSLSNTNRDQLIETLNNATQQLHDALSEASHLILTLGTAWAYKHNESSEYVANCHKVPQHQFSKELLSIADISGSLRDLISSVHTVNPDCHIIFTVSPVRHIKDGFVENQHSKANLISALHDKLASADASYFPSYEIMMDELRDYRFYAEDMLHPNQVAVDYIWQRFKDTYISESAYAIMDKTGNIQKGLSHRPFNPDTAQHKAFRENLQNEITQLQSQFPYMKF
jgi:GSCFA family protein